MENYDIEIDTSGLNCPLPVLKAKKALAGMNAGQRLHLIATDIGSKQDIPAFCKMTANPLVELIDQGQQLRFIIEKGA